MSRPCALGVRRPPNTFLIPAVFGRVVRLFGRFPDEISDIWALGVPKLVAFVAHPPPASPFLSPIPSDEPTRYTGMASTKNAATAGVSTGDQAPPKATPTDKRLVVVASNTAAAAAAAAAKKKGGAARSPPALPAALRPPTARPGDIGFRGGVGFRMRPPPPPTPAKSGAAAATAVAAAATQAATVTPTIRGGRDGRSGGGSGGGAGLGAAALTAAAAAKIRTRSCTASIRGSARQRGGGAVAAYKEAKGSRAAQEDAAAAAIMAKLAGGGRGKGRGGSGAAGGGEGEDVESLQEQVRSFGSFSFLPSEKMTQEAKSVGGQTGDGEMRACLVAGRRWRASPEGKYPSSFFLSFLSSRCSRP